VCFPQVIVDGKKHSFVEEEEKKKLRITCYTDIMRFMWFYLKYFPDTNLNPRKYGRIQKGEKIVWLVTPLFKTERRLDKSKEYVDRLEG